MVSNHGTVYYLLQIVNITRINRCRRYNDVFFRPIVNDKIKLSFKFYCMLEKRVIRNISIIGTVNITLLNG